MAAHFQRIAVQFPDFAPGESGGVFIVINRLPTRPAAIHGRGRRARNSSGGRNHFPEHILPAHRWN